MNNKEKLEKARLERLNNANVNKQGLYMTIVNYNSSKNIDVLFEDGYIATNKLYKHFKSGSMKSPYFKSIYNRGYLGEGEYISSHDFKHNIQYSKWFGMFKRCYDEKQLAKQPTYEICDIDERWNNFQVFAKWFDENRWSEDCLCVDKDILIKGNKIYSPENCILVDNRLNCLFTKTNKTRGNFPIGVYYKKDVKKYRAQCSIVFEDGHKQQTFLGDYSDPLTAFNAYKQFKESYIKQVADDYANKYQNFPKRLYDAMYAYEVEITD